MKLLDDSAVGSDGPRIKPVIVFAVVALVLALRIAHLSSALQSPLTYQPGPDEDYYQRFGAAVASGHGSDSSEFTFMDPGYGYLLGGVFKLAGVNVFLVYLLQTLLDTATAFAILAAGRLLGRPWAGVYGALVYGFTATAIMFCTTLLKETCVAAFMAWWVVAALALGRSERALAWALFGALCGVGVALRSTLSMLCLAALALPWMLRRPAALGAPTVEGPGLGRSCLTKSLLIAAGAVAALTPWSLRDLHATGSLSPLPHNGGIVLHQVYNADNPGSAIWVPPFVNYLHPSEIWRGYAAEANRRVGRALSPKEVDQYWQSQALAFIRAHPGEVAEDVARKNLIFLSGSEVPNNRSSEEERMFSPVLSMLPRPAPILLGLGLAGLLGFAFRDRRWPILAAPIALSAFTFAFFWAEDRFRFHAAPVLALCAGLLLDQIVDAARNLRTAGWRARGWRAVGAGGLAVLIGSVSWFLGVRHPPPVVRWDHVVWGYIKMGRLEAARQTADKAVAEQPDNGPVFEAIGFLAASDGRYADAVAAFQRAVALRPRSYVAHYNLAKAWLAQGARDKAAAEARIAADLDPSPEALALIERIGTAP